MSCRTPAPPDVNRPSAHGVVQPCHLSPLWFRSEGAKSLSRIGAAQGAIIASVMHRCDAILCRSYPENRGSLGIRPHSALYINNLGKTGWGGRIRTYDTRYQKPMPYHLATPQLCGGFYPSMRGAASLFFVQFGNNSSCVSCKAESPPYARSAYNGQMRTNNVTNQADACCVASKLFRHAEQAVILRKTPAALLSMRLKRA